MPNPFLPEKEVIKLKQDYPRGTRILLEHMDDQWAVPPGTRGSVLQVDDGGNIHMKWDNGRTLSIVPEADRFRKLTDQELLEEQQLKNQEHRDFLEVQSL